jgi:hypothetical protein
MGIFSSLFGSPAKAKSVQNPASVWTPQTPFLTQNYQAGQNLATQQMAPGSNFQDMLGQQQGAWQNLLSGSANPYLSGMAGNAMSAITKQFQEQIMPALLGGGNAAGQLGGERYQNLQDSAARTAMDATAAAGADVYGRAWDSGLQAQLGALGESSQVQGAAWQPLLQQAKLLGGPTVLGGGGTSTSTGASEGILGTLAKFKPSGGGSWFPS